MTVAQQLYEGIEIGDEGAGRPHHVHADGLRAHRRGGAGGGARVGDRAVRRRVPARDAARLQVARQRAGGARGDPPVRRRHAIPAAVARFLTKDQLALYRLIWERFMASQLMPAVYDTVAADITGGRRCRASARRARRMKFKGFTAVYVESREEDDAAADDEAESAIPPLDEGEVLTLLGPRSQAALHAAAAALHRGLAHQGAGGAGDRPAVDVRLDPRHDHQRPRLRPPRAAHAVPDRARHDGDRQARCRSSGDIMDVEFTAQMED